MLVWMDLWLQHQLKIVKQWKRSELAIRVEGQTKREQEEKHV